MYTDNLLCARRPRNRRNPNTFKNQTRCKALPDPNLTGLGALACETGSVTATATAELIGPARDLLGYEVL